MQLNKVHTFYIPVGLLDLTVKVKGISKLLVEQSNHRLPDVMWSIIARGKLFKVGIHYCAPFQNSLARCGRLSC
jgi:hypothetical protein